MSKTEFWVGKQVLVTGAGGFIGSHLIEQLVRQNSCVKAFVRYNSRGDPGLLSLLSPDVLENVEIIGGDLRDLPALMSAMRGIQVVFHLGALISIPYSYFHPAEVAQTNFMGTLNVLLAGRDAAVERIVHTSTSEVYGTAMTVPIDEAHPLQGQSPYSASKIGADKLAESFYCAYGLPVTTIRPFNTYGPRQSARAVIPTIITQALTQDVVYLGNLDAVRDFMYVTDTVDGFIKAAQTPGVDGQVFNLGVGSAVRIGQLAEQVIMLTGRKVEVRLDATRLRPAKSEVQRLISNNSLAREKLGWSPKVDFPEGLSRTVEWISKNIHLYQPRKYQI